MPHVSKNTLFIIFFSGLVLIFLFLTLGNILIGQQSLTYDEKSHYRYAELIYRLKPDRFDDSKMPVSVINVIPVKIAENVFGVEFTDKAQKVKLGRVSTVFVSLLLACLCYFWMRSLYGKWAGLLGLGLFVFEPNIIAHSQLVTTDIFAAASMTLALYMCWRFFSITQSPTRNLFRIGIGSLPDQQIFRHTFVPNTSIIRADPQWRVAARSDRAKSLEKPMGSIVGIDQIWNYDPGNFFVRYQHGLPVRSLRYCLGRLPIPVEFF